MKKNAFFLLFLLLSWIGFAQNFTVKDFSAVYEMNPEGYFDVVENYEVEFHSASHGIFRDILIEYYLDSSEKDENPNKRNVIIRNVKVPGQKFKLTPNTERGQFGAKNLNIRIGDPDRMVNGIQHYEISYRVYNAFLVSDSLVQFYWNAKAPEWVAPFEKVSFKVKAPQGIQLSENNSFVYSGLRGGEQRSDEFTTSYEGSVLSAVSKPDFQSGYGDAVTVLIKLPAGTISGNLIEQSAFQKYGWLAIPVLMIAFFIRLRRKYGKEKVISVTSYYPPKGIDPAMAGYLIDDSADTHDLVSLIPKWGQEGVIRMEEIPKKGWFGSADLKLFKLKEIDENAPKYEEEMFTGLFKDSGNEVLISSLKESFYTTMNSAKENLKFNAKPFYEEKPQKIKLLTSLGVVLGLILIGLCYYVFGALAAVVVGITGAGLWFLTLNLKKKNPEGNQILSELKGFRQFIKLAETNRIKTLIQDDPNYFEKTMSYALAFGLLKQWAGKFEALDIQPPQWYSGPIGVPGSYSMSNFANSFSGNMATMQSNMISSPSSSGSGGGFSGGGSSGGGFGGGGGGSW